MLPKPLLAAAALATGSLAFAQSASIGDHPSYAFRSPPTNSMGVGNLADMQGKPVLIEFWGTR